MKCIHCGKEMINMGTHYTCAEYLPKNTIIPRSVKYGGPFMVSDVPNVTVKPKEWICTRCGKGGLMTNGEPQFPCEHARTNKFEQRIELLEFQLALERIHRDVEHVESLYREARAISDLLCSLDSLT